MIKIRGRTKKEKAKQLVALLLSAVMLISCAFAYLTATDSKTNKFTFGKVDVELWENFDKNKDGAVAEDGSETFGPESPEGATTVENIVAGQEITKAPWIKNTGDAPAYVYLMVGIPKDTCARAVESGLPLDSGAETEGEMFTIKGLNTGLTDNQWTLIASQTDGSDVSMIATGNDAVAASENAFNYYIFAYNSILPNEDDESTQDEENLTSVLFSSVQFDNIIANNGNVDGKFGPYEIPVYAFAIQAMNSEDASGLFATPQDAWNAYVDQVLSIFPSTVRKDQYIVTLKYDGSEPATQETYYGTRRSYNVNTPLEYPVLNGVDVTNTVWIDSDTGTMFDYDANAVVDDVLVKNGSEIINNWPVWTGYIKESASDVISDVTIGDIELVKNAYKTIVNITVDSSVKAVAFPFSVSVNESWMPNESLEGQPYMTTGSRSVNGYAYANSSDAPFAGDGYEFLGSSTIGNETQYSFKVTCGSINDLDGTLTIDSIRVIKETAGSVSSYASTDASYTKSFTRNFDNTIKSITSQQIGMEGSPLKYGTDSRGRTYQIYSCTVKTGPGANILAVTTAYPGPAGNEFKHAYFQTEYYPLDRVSVENGQTYKTVDVNIMSPMCNRIGNEYTGDGALIIFNVLHTNGRYEYIGGNNQLVNADYSTGYEDTRVVQATFNGYNAVFTDIYPN